MMIEIIIDVYNYVFDLLETITVCKNANSMQHLVLSFIKGMTMPWIIKLENKYPFHSSHLEFIESVPQSFSSALNRAISLKWKTTTKHVRKHNSAVFFSHSQID